MELADVERGNRGSCVKVAVFGGSGRVGHIVIAKALDRGWDVVAYVRSPSRLRLTHERLRVAVGELDDHVAIACAVRDADAVISALGPGFTTWTLAIASGLDSMIDAMRAHGVRRLIVLATPSYRDSRDGRDPVFATVVLAVHLLLPVAWRTVVAMCRSTAGSGLDWTIVRVPLLSNAETTALPVTGSVGDPDIRFTRVSRATVAEFLVAQIEDSSYLCSAPVISRRGTKRP